MNYAADEQRQIKKITADLLGSIDKMCQDLEGADAVIEDGKIMLRRKGHPDIVMDAGTPDEAA